MDGYKVKGEDQDYWCMRGVNKVISEKAILFEIDGLFGETWIPKSQLEDWPRKGEHGDIVMTCWIAQQKGLM